MITDMKDCLLLGEISRITGHFVSLLSGKRKQIFATVYQKETTKCNTFARVRITAEMSISVSEYLGLLLETTSIKTMEPTLPLKSLVLILFCGLMALVIAIIVAKRQILRFNLRSRGLHVPIGSAAPKSLKEEIDRRLRRAKDIKYEPHLLKGCEDTFKANINGEVCHFLYRMKAIDALVLLDEELASYSPLIKRKVGCNLRGFLLEQRIAGPLEGIQVDVLEKFSESYEHARHEPAEFRATQYEEYMELLNQIIEHIRNKKNEKKNIAKKGKDIEKSLLTATFIPSSQDSKIDNRIISQVADNSVVNNEDPVQITYRPTTKSKGLGAVIMMPGRSSSSSAGECSSSVDASSEHSSKDSAKYETSV